MTMAYDLIKQLITQAEAFEQQNPDRAQHTLATFIAWQNQQFVQPAEPPEKNADNLLAGADAPDTQIGVMISYLYRYTKLYGKKILADTSLSTIDEFSYLVMLLEPGAPTKTELIERNVHEKTTGTEILRRLINGGLVEQIDDEVDRRSKRLKLTEKGMSVMVQVMPQLDQLVKLVGGNLTVAEKTQLVALLTKLHLFHNHLFHTERNTPVETLVKGLGVSK